MMIAPTIQYQAIISDPDVALAPCELVVGEIRATIWYLTI